MTMPIRHGSAYWIPDTAVALPPTIPSERVQHPRRPFLVYSNDGTNADHDWPIVSGFPLSTSDEFATEFDVRLNRGQAGLPDDCWVLVALFQPISKSKLREWIGPLDANTVEQVTAQFLRYNGVIE